MVSNGHHPTNGNGIDTSATTSSSHSLYNVCWELKRKVDSFLQEEGQTELLKGVQDQLTVAMGVVREALKRYRSEQIALSYNGGKDCKFTGPQLEISIFSKYYKFLY